MASSSSVIFPATVIEYVSVLLNYYYSILLPSLSTKTFNAIWMYVCIVVNRLIVSALLALGGSVWYLL